MFRPMTAFCRESLLTKQYTLSVPLQTKHQHVTHGHSLFKRRYQHW